MPDVFRLDRPNNVPLEFEGERLACVSSKDWASKDPQRWEEILIYRTASGKWVVQSIGRTTMPGEQDIPRVVVAETPDEVRNALKKHQGERVYLTSLAIRALEEAVAADASLSGALVERI